LTDPGGGKASRQIGGLAAALLAFNGLVGAGIFVLPGLVFAEFGAFGPWLFPLFGLLMLIVVVPLAAAAARFDISGGPMAYVRDAFGPAAGFQAGWLYYLAKLTALAANATVFASYAVGLFPQADGAVQKALIVVLLLAGLGAANWAGLKRAVRVLEWVSVLKAAPLILFALAGLLLFWSALPAPGPLPPLSALEASALVIFYAFVGFENVLVAAGETKDARRTIPRALVQTILATALFYFLIQLAFTAVAPEARAEAPMIAFGAAIAGTAGAVVMTLTALMSLVGNLHSNLLSTPRMTDAMAAQGLLPAWFGRRDARFGTPANAILFFTVAAILLALSGGFVLLAVLGTVARLILLLMVYAAIPRLRATKGERAMPPPALLAIIGGATLICLWALAQNEPKAWVLLAASVGVGTLLYLVARRRA
jgi:APA family basic amino acid/polyamine antiporter